MNIELLSGEFAICNLADSNKIDFSHPFVFFAKTDDEISLVCETKYIPENALSVHHGWKGFRIKGTLDFDMVGVIAKIADLLAKRSISIFVISTYKTDYVLIQGKDFDIAIVLLKNQGYRI